jgi:hypothetical protein
MVLRLDNRPLLSTFDDAELFVEPPALSRVRAAVSRRLNVLILGAPGAGKTTFLHRIASEVEAGGAHLPPVYVDLSPAADAAQALALILEALGQRDFVQAWGDPGFRPPSTPSAGLIALVRRLRQAPPSYILADSPPGNGETHLLFGRLRDELWQLDHRWVVAAPSVQRDEVSRPPADAFFDVRVELGALADEDRQELLRRRLANREDLDLVTLAAASDGLPRSLIALARETVLSDRSPQELLAAREALQARLDALPGAASAAYAYLTANGPVSASDEGLLAAMGYSPQRARVVLGELEADGLARSFLDRQERRGRPRKVYEAVSQP